MKIGSIIRADNSGLGTLAREFWDNGVIQKALIHPNGVYKIFPERFPGALVSKDLSKKDLDWLLEGLDALLFFETPFDWSIIPQARKKGIKTVLMPMHECLPEALPYVPDLFIAPSLLETKLGLEPIEFVPVPINTDRIRWRLRKKAQVFVHNAGHGGLSGRNGTAELLEAMRYVKSDIKLIIRSQSMEYEIKDPRIEMRYMNAENYWDIWDEGDVFIFPEQFNGLSLPLQEAFAAGMLVMSTNRFPTNTWLPNAPLIRPDSVRRTRISRYVEASVCNPEEIAMTIDAWAGREISEYSRMGRSWAWENSWAKLKPKYLELCAK